MQCMRSLFYTELILYIFGVIFIIVLQLGLKLLKPFAYDRRTADDHARQQDDPAVDGIQYVSETYPPIRGLSIAPHSPPSGQQIKRNIAITVIITFFISSSSSAQFALFYITL